MESQKFYLYQYQATFKCQAQSLGSGLKSLDSTLHYLSSCLFSSEFCVRSSLEFRSLKLRYSPRQCTAAVLAAVQITVHTTLRTRLGLLTSVDGFLPIWQVKSLDQSVNRIYLMHLCKNISYLYQLISSSRSRHNLKWSGFIWKRSGQTFLGS